MAAGDGTALGQVSDGSGRWCPGQPPSFDTGVVAPTLLPGSSTATCGLIPYLLIGIQFRRVLRHFFLLSDSDYSYGIQHSM
jgi:hypothetical protein